MKDLGAKPIIYPMPVLIIAAYDKEGKIQLMNAAWGGISDNTEITIAVSECHKTTEAFKYSKCFTVAIADVNTVIEADYVGIVSGNNEIDKFKKTGLNAIKSKNIDAPIITNFPISLECKVKSYSEEVLKGEIINCVCKEDILGSDGLPDLTKFTPITYDPIHHNYVALGQVVDKAFNCGKKIK